MPQLNTVFARALQMARQAIRAPANPHHGEWSSLSPTAMSLLMPATPGLPMAKRQPNHADVRR